MKKNQKLLSILTIAVVAALCVTAFAVEPGSKKDPLVTLSYLEDIFFDEIMDKVDERIGERNKEIAEEISGESASESADTFSVVTLSNGQVLTGDIGCEVMLRVGSAVCTSPSAPGLIDETNATTLNNGGSLQQNHMYMMTIEDRGVKATSDTVKVLVRGGYTIE
ncbi:MAG: hypothetical protein IJX52_02580 [Oscillibacter sp.]|nr:hypothetical protein [Oscillibacter sp.]